MLSPRLIVLGTELPDESGWLACAKLNIVPPSASVILSPAPPTRSANAWPPSSVPQDSYAVPAV